MTCENCKANSVCNHNKYGFETCNNFIPLVVGVWKDYSATMMECSICGRHTARHKYDFCPRCGSKMLRETIQPQINKDTYQQLTIFDHIPKSTASKEV